MEATVQVNERDAVVNQRDELIVSHLPLVRHVVARVVALLPHSVDVENLEGAGVLGLVEAASHFSPGRGGSFQPYAHPRIRGAVLDELRRNCPLPQHLLERLARVRQAHQTLRPPVTAEALSATTGLSAEDVAECLAALRLTRMLSMDRAGRLEAAWLDSRQVPPHAGIEEAERREMLGRAIMALPEREGLIVTLYYLENRRLKEIGVSLGLSESRVSRVLHTALVRLGEFLRSHDAA